MTIPEACQLIMQAAAIGQGGEIFVLDMGEAVRISYLAEQMIRLSGKLPGEEIAIEYVGLRRGEKLFEELFYESEDLAETVHPKIRVARRGAPLASEDLKMRLDALKAAIDAGDDASLRARLQELLPEWREGPGGRDLESGPYDWEVAHG